MTDNSHKPGGSGPDDLQTPFLFVPHGAPEPVEWMRKHPGWVKFPATFVPRAAAAVRTIPGTNRPWPLDKRGQPWPRSRFGQPLRPLDEYPPGVRAPGEGYTGPIADPDVAMRAAVASQDVLAQAAKDAAAPDAPIKVYLNAMEVWRNPAKYADPDALVRAYLESRYPRESPEQDAAPARPEATPVQFVPVMPTPPFPAPGMTPPHRPASPSRAKPPGSTPHIPPGSTPKDNVEALIPPAPIPPVHDTPAPPPNQPEVFPGDEGARQPPLVTPPGPQLPAVEEMIPPVFDPATVFERNELRKNMEARGTVAKGQHAHHIVPGGGPQSGGRNPTLTQQRLKALGVGLNDAENGVALSPEFHRYVHTKGYYDYVEAQLAEATSKQTVIDKLEKIGKELKDAEQIYKDTGALPTWR